MAYNFNKTSAQITKEISAHFQKTELEFITIAKKASSIEF